MQELLTLMFTTFVVPVGIGMIQNYYEDAESRKGAVGVCPPHNWISVIDNINTMTDSLVCENCNYRNNINN